MQKPRIGITVGDINGIGMEVIIKALDHPHITNICTPVIYGSSKVTSYFKNIIGNIDLNYFKISSSERLKWDRINLYNCWEDGVQISLGKVTEEGGRCAKISLAQAMHDLNQKYIDGVVTAPIHKKAMQMAGFEYPGHTEYFAKESGVKESLMFMVHQDIKVGLVTNHLPLSEVRGAITQELIQKKIEIMDQVLRRDFGVEKPVIAVLGLNPHAGDEGVIGNEEEEIIRPAIISEKKKGKMVMGPFPADGFFGSGQYRKVDAVLAMYHDQGLIPFKLLSFGSGVNYTAGLPFVRTSPDHGTAFDIAGKNIADPSSFRQALFTAIDIVNNRVNYDEMFSNPLRNKATLVDEKIEGDG